MLMHKKRCNVIARDLRLVHLYQRPDHSFPNFDGSHSLEIQDTMHQTAKPTVLGPVHVLSSAKKT